MAGERVRAAPGDDRPGPGDADQAGAGRHRASPTGTPTPPSGRRPWRWCRSGYADGVPRHASNRGPVQLGGEAARIAGRVCMDQIVLDCGDDPVAAGDVATLFGSGADGEPTADDWAEAVGTINYEIVTRFGGVRVPRVYDGERRMSQRRGSVRGRGPARRARAARARHRRRGGRGRRGRASPPGSRPSGPWSAGSRPTRPTRTPTSRSAS